MLSANKLRTVILVSGFAMMVASGRAYAESAYTRYPVVAGAFYPEDTDQLRELIGKLTRRAGPSAPALPYGTSLKGLILPHAGYEYSGWTTAHAAAVLSGLKNQKIILLGSDHRIGFTGVAVSSADQFQTPMGPIPVHPDAGRLRELSPWFKPVKASDQREHALEVILPFLQTYVKGFTLVPMVTGTVKVERVIDGIESILDGDTLLIASSDLSHSLPYDAAVRIDQETIGAILRLESGSIIRKKNSACGALPIEAMIQVAIRHHWQPMLLHYANSGDTAGDKTAVVGYAAIAFFGEMTMNQKKKSTSELTDSQGTILLQLARNTILETFDKKPALKALTALDASLRDKDLEKKQGVFVTLKLNHELRGCIGNLSASESIVSGVRRNALNAAFHDPRFQPLTRKELDTTDIEISVLSEPQALAYEDAADLVTRLRPHVDGVILKKGHASATFLPQVWEQLPAPESFLSHLCLKAGLASDEWKTSRLTILTYQVQYFEEEN